MAYFLCEHGSQLLLPESLESLLLTRDVRWRSIVQEDAGVDGLARVSGHLLGAGFHASPGLDDLCCSEQVGGDSSPVINFTRSHDGGAGGVPRQRDGRLCDDAVKGMVVSIKHQLVMDEDVVSLRLLFLLCEAVFKGESRLAL